MTTSEKFRHSFRPLAVAAITLAAAFLAARSPGVSAVAAEQEPAQAAVGAAPAATPRKPNILFIMTDQQRYDGMSCHGGQAKTPNLDRLAAAGADFRQYFTQALVLRALALATCSRAATATATPTAQDHTHSGEV